MMASAPSLPPAAAAAAGGGAELLSSFPACTARRGGAHAGCDDLLPHPCRIPRVPQHVLVFLPCGCPVVQGCECELYTKGARACARV
ncbi:hypothetical protein EON66_01985 [archaeon]|nr:MAG: hypothetical protein EON66_01985 [archaeon]